MNEIKSKVYIKTDVQNRITNCDGGYTTPADLTGWTEIDQGTGDRYNLCQSHYFNGGLRTADGIFRYKWVDGATVLRSADEIEGDRMPSMDARHAAKLSELSNACNIAITAGCDVTLTDGTVEHFSLQETDQINLSTAVAACEQGATAYPYHADGQLCRLYPAADIVAIGTAATKHKLYHTTYCNHVMTWARRAGTTDELQGISYGAALPEDLAANMEAVLGNAGS